MFTDSILLNLRSAILENPNDDTIRGEYADRMEFLGDTQTATMIREQLADPHTSRPVTGPEAGIPLASMVSIRRGFVDTITVPREHCVRLGEILRDHPITSVRVDDIDEVVGIRHAVPYDSELGMMWEACIGMEFPGRGMITFLISSSRSWNHRDQMVQSIGAWLDDELLTPNPEFDRAWRSTLKSVDLNLAESR